ncbi:MAG: type I polyketide synthase [Nostoc sp. CmiVER01]|uniref:type I polyketide synthase n=1 Tax=Nostoc sp. CmiVER01 TaxID=3075384 RepID=UPI002AD523B6|nr:type I polyketide synthase [Nostoc sp. CmiVER01]MDZ8121564.1 type I polyketide synthase [Nostoc sp. CmiVER01]
MDQISERFSHLSPLKQAFLKLEEMQSKLEAMERRQNEPIAIVGMACRFPGGADLESFWQLCKDGVDAIKEVPSNRWDLNIHYDSNPASAGKIYTRRGGFLERVDEFDAAFFGIAPREVVSLDPQQRLLLEVSWEALENASQAPDKLHNSSSGVFVGINSDDYKQLQLMSGDAANLNAYTFTGNTASVAAGRLSYFLGLQGPTLAVDTACSSSLVAVHLACQSLRNGECRLALAGGVNLMLSENLNIVLCRMQALSPDGYCKTFDAEANGYGRGEGCGIVVLKRLTDAIADNDNILAVIRGTAINHDGRSSGLTVPNGLAQQALINTALANGRVEPAQISYVEVHGTGTALGDPIEVEALASVLGKGRSPNQPLVLGSVKPNIGHLEAAAGIAGLIKVVLAMQHREIPPHLHLKKLNPAIAWEELPVAIPTDLTPWPSIDSQRRIAGVSSFGMSGTNAHIVLEEAGELGSQHRRATETFERPQHILTLSAKNEIALQELAQRYCDYLTANPTESLADICFTANTGRSHFEHRLAIVADSLSSLHQQLETSDVDEYSVKSAHPHNRKIAFLFTGQGSQYINMARELYQTQPTFRACIDQCEEILRPYLETSLLDVLYPSETANAKLDQTAYTQPALFAVEYALAGLWQSWGIRPTIVMGHSVGEYVAACIAGVFSLEDGLKLIAERGRLMQALPSGGEMAVVFSDLKQVTTAVAPYAEQISIAAINGPESIVISGRCEAVQAVLAKLEAKGIETRQLKVSHAFHSPLMEPILNTFEQIAAQVKYSSPKIALISNVTGKLTTGKEIAKPGYWSRHIRDTVRFSASMQTLHEQGYEIFIEIGPSPVLLGMGRQCLPENNQVWLPSLRKKHSNWQTLLSSVKNLYLRGVELDWSRFDKNYPRHRLQLPTYPFQRSHYWIESVKSAQTATLAPDKDWFYEVQWQPKTRMAAGWQRMQPEQPGSWLIFADRGGVGLALASLFEKQGETCFIVFASEADKTSQPGHKQIDPRQLEDFQSLLQEVLASDNRPSCRGVVHLWSLDSTATEVTTIDSLETDQDRNCGSILHLVQALCSVKFPQLPRLWLVTQNTQPIEVDSLAVAQAPIWGLGRVIALEHPEMFAGLVDLGNSASLEGAAQMLFEELRNPEVEMQVALRDTHRFVARLVPSQGEKVTQSFRIQNDRTYLITGGLGGLGLKVAQWLVDQGVRYLVLVGRSAVCANIQTQLLSLQNQGVQVLVAQADISQKVEVERVFADISKFPSLAGIIHMAGVLDDGVLLKQDWNRFVKVMAPKVAGAWNLHTQTQDMPLDFLINFSSAASLHGSLGQGSYAAANAFLDTLAHYRQLQGLPALSINWSSWDEVGMAATMASRDQQRWTDAGVSFIAIKQGLQVLGQLLKQKLPQIGVLAVDWSKYFKLFPSNFASSFLSEIASETPLTTQYQQLEILQRLKKTPPNQQKNALISYIQNKVAAVLRLDAELIKPHVGFFEMGMDSLMAVDLKNILQKSLGHNLDSTLTFEYPNIESLSEYLLKEIILVESLPDSQKQSDQNTEEQAKILAQIQELSEEELAALVDKELETLGIGN